MKTPVLFATVAMLFFTIPCHAQQSAVTGKSPLTITADQTLEWQRTGKKFIARGAVHVTQDDVAIHADVLTADYRETSSTPISIDRLIAEGNVSITSQGNNATGDKAVYEVGSGMAIMTGKSLKLTAPDQIVTARDRFEYNAKEGRLSAIGDAVATRGEDTLRADRMSALFAPDASGKRQLKELGADGGVVIKTPAETLRGDRGRYTAANQVAELNGNVKIERGPNILEGERAEVNLATNISRLFGNPEQGGRVRGTFYPDNQSPPVSPQKENNPSGERLTLP